MADLRAYARGAAVRNGIDPDKLVLQVQQESGFNPKAYNAASGASGIAQIVERFHPGVNVWDPEASLDYMARLMAEYLARFGTYPKALAAYNWGSGNVGGGTWDGVYHAPWDGRRETLPAETRRYLDVILGPSWDKTGGTPPVATMKLSDVLARMRSMTGAPYVFGGNAPASPDCSEAVSYAYQGKVPGFTDAIYDATERVDGKDVAPGDIVLYEYKDPEQPGVRFPHVALYLSDTRVLDARFGFKLGERDQLSRSKATRYYRRLPGVAVDTLTQQPPIEPPTQTSDAETIKGLRVAVAYLADDVIPLAVAGTEQRERAMKEAQRVREEFVGPKPAAVRAPS